MLLTTTENCGCGIGREKSFESSAVEIDSLKIKYRLGKQQNITCRLVFKNIYQRLWTPLVFILFIFSSFLSQNKRFGGNLGKLPWNAAGSIDNHWFSGGQWVDLFDAKRNARNSERIIPWAIFSCSSIKSKTSSYIQISVMKKNPSSWLIQSNVLVFF